MNPFQSPSVRCESRWARNRRQALQSEGFYSAVTAICAAIVIFVVFLSGIPIINTPNPDGSLRLTSVLYIVYTVVALRFAISTICSSIVGYREDIARIYQDQN